MMAFCIHENKWPWGNTVNVISSRAEACVQLSFEDENPGVCFLSGLSVHTDFRRKGYATRLMRFCEKLCKERGIFRIDLCSVQTDYVLEFYKKLGYSPIKEENGFIKMYKMLESTSSKSQWKPSENQMKILFGTFNHSRFATTPNQYVLASLYDDLKQLM